MNLTSENAGRGGGGEHQTLSPLHRETPTPKYQ